jgi:O-antigen/teichoic acid export membrane protein
MGRVDNAARNIKYGYVGKIVQLLLGFISRTVFIYTLGVTFLGVNGLYTNVLGVLSLAELGIGTAMNYSLYKPVATGDLEKIKSLMNLYKRAYRVIALVVSVMGLLLVPFLKYIIKDPGNITIDELTIFYLIFLFNTVSTYFVAYKYSLVNAEQKNYIQTNIQAITTLITVIGQIIILVVFKDFLLYLLIGAIIGLIQKIGVNMYLNRLYPYLLDKNVKKLSQEEKAPIKKNIKALILQRIGSISVHQTDNIIISSFINITTVGLISNYNLIITSVSGFINVLFTSLIPGFGNLIATENKEKQYFIFKVSRFLVFWIHGFASIAFLILLTPFIQLWIGKDMVIGSTVIYLIIINYYFMGHRLIIALFYSAAGIFDKVKYIAIIQAVVNLVISIVMVQKIGLEGVFIGTICSGLVSTIATPIIVYRSIFNRSALEYYKDSIIYLLAIGIALTALELIKYKIFIESSIMSFITLMIFVTVVPNIVFYIFFRKREEFHYLYSLLSRKLHRRS